MARAPTSITRRRRRCGRRRSRRCCPTSATTTAIPVDCTPKATRRVSRSRTAREQVAALFGAPAREVVFTASGTEAVNTAVWGALARATPMRRGHVVTTAVEHSAVLDAVAAATDDGHRGRRRPAGPLRSRRGRRRRARRHRARVDPARQPRGRHPATGGRGGRAVRDRERRGRARRRVRGRRPRRPSTSPRSVPTCAR